MNRLFALTSRGLEDIAAAEIASLPGVTVSGSSYRQVDLTAAALAPLLKLRTCDDLYLDLADWQVEHTRLMLPRFIEQAARLDLNAARAALESLRPLPKRPTFSVSASFVGARNYSSEEIKQAIAAGVQAAHGWPYSSDDRAAQLNLRVFIEHQRGRVGLRLSERPQHERPYKQAERPGALKASVAAALCRMAGVSADTLVIDPCCGSGTLLFEAAALGAMALGGDMDAGAVEAAAVNRAAADGRVGLMRWDARRLPLAADSVPIVISNPPWGRQIAADAALSDFYRGLADEIARVLRPGGRALLLTSLPELLADVPLTLLETRTISLYGQQPTILTLIKG